MEICKRDQLRGDRSREVEWGPSSEEPPMECGLMSCCGVCVLQTISLVLPGKAHFLESAWNLYIIGPVQMLPEVLFLWGKYVRDLYR